MPPETMLIPAADRASEEVLAELRRFASDGWGVAPAVSPGAPDRFAGLLGAPLLQDLLRDVRVPVEMYRVILDGQPQPPALTSVPMRGEDDDVIPVLDPIRLRTEMRKGASLMLAGLDEYWPPVRRFCLELSRRSGLDVSVSAVVIPPGGRGFDFHADQADQLVLQCEGTGEWSAWPPTPPEIGPRPVDTDGLPAPLYTGKLAAGVALYLPGGAPHRAGAGEALSIHLSVTLASPTPAGVALDAARTAAIRARDAATALPPFWFEDPGPHAARIQRVTEDILVGAAATVAGDVLSRAQRLSRRAG